jgi:Carboxypeptidase regulatory-like domain/TonB-dependent Receptor Plug Domain
VKILVLRFAHILILTTLLALLAHAQTITGSLNGTVVDQSNQVLAGAKITLTSEKTGDVRSTTANESGSFNFLALLPGTYSIKVEQQGFKSVQRKDIILSANDRISLGDLQLSVGEISETVTTTAEGSLVQTASSEHSAQITSKQLQLISQRGRDVTSLLKILPGVSYGGESESAGGGFGSGIPNIQGGRNTWNTLNVDGMRGNDLGSPSTFSSTVNFDAIGEVKVLLNSYQAEYASNASAAVNIVTKSGTTQYHGSGYWYKRHEQFNANNFFNNATVTTSAVSGITSTIPKPRYRYSTLGATFGGPVWLPIAKEKIKDKLFFFYSFEDSQTLNPQALRTVTVPTALERAGDFSKSYTSLDANLNPIALYIRDPLKTGTCSAADQTACFTGNVVPTARLNKNGQALMNIFPLPNATSLAITKGAYNYTFQESIKVPKRQNLFKVDYKPNSKDSFYVRGSTWYADNQGIAVPAGTANWGLAGLHYTFTDNGITGNWARVITPSLINEASLGVRHSVENGPFLSDAELAKVQRKTYNFNLGQFFPDINPLGIVPQVSFSGITNAAAVSYDGRLPLRGADTLITFNDNVTWTKGSHVLKGGIYFERARNYEGATSTFGGNFNFSNDANNPLNSGYAYSNAALGNFTNYQESNARPSGEGRQSIFDFYAQDSWKVSRHLNIEVGVRFGWYNQWYQDTGKAAAFSLDRYTKAKTPKFYLPGCAVTLPANGVCPTASRRALNPVNNELLPNVLVGAFVPGSGDLYNGMVIATDGSYPRGFRGQQPIQVQPRFGFSWDIFGNGKTALRGSVGQFNQTRVSANAVWNDVSRNPPISETPQIFYGNMDSLLSSKGSLFPAGTVAGFDLTAKTPVTYNYNLGIQRDVGFGTVVDISYVGSQSRHLQQVRNINLIPYGARFATANQNPVVAGTALIDNLLRPYPGYGTINYFENTGTSNYNALQVAVNRRFIRGVQFGLAYTYSKTMDFSDDDRGTVATYRPLKIWNYGKALFDQTHVMVINYTWDLPKASKLVDNILVRSIFDNWQISGLTAFASGTPAGIGYTLVDGADITGGGDGGRIVITGKPTLADNARTIAPTGSAQRPLLVRQKVILVTRQKMSSATLAHTTGIFHSSKIFP